MLDERSAAAFSKAGDDVDHARGQAAVGEILGQFENSERSLLGRLENARAARGDGGGQFPCGHEERIVPRNDLSGDADRLFERKGHRIVGNWIHVTDNFGGEAAVIFEAGGGVVDVELGLDDGLAGVAAFEFGERGKIAADFFRETEQDSAAFLRGGARPRTFFKSGLGRGYGTVDVVGAGVGDLRDYFFRGGIVDGERLRGCARDPFAVDVHLISADFVLGFGCDSAGHFVSTSCFHHGLKPQILSNFSGTTAVVSSRFLLFA